MIVGAPGMCSGQEFCDNSGATIMTDAGVCLASCAVRRRTTGSGAVGKKNGLDCKW